MTEAELRLQIYLAMLVKSGVREWENPQANQALWEAAILAADGLQGIIPGEPDPDPDPEQGNGVTTYFKTSEGTAKTIKASGGTATITVASLANGNGTSAGARQSSTLDLGANWAQRWRLEVDREIAATPTAGAQINFFASWKSATGAGQGNTSGSDAAYTGYSNNIDAAVKHLDPIGVHVCTSQATATVQKSIAGEFRPKGRNMNLVEDNRSGAAYHSTDTNQEIRLIPLEYSHEE